MSTAAGMSVERTPARARFVRPEHSDAAVPPEVRGLARDQVRMLVVSPAGTDHRVVRDLPNVLHPGDLLVVNTSATLPAAVAARWRELTTAVHISTELDSGHWVVEVRHPDNSGPARPDRDEVLRLPGGVRLRLLAPHPDDGQQRLWRAAPVPSVRRIDYLARHGRPIRYPYVAGEWPLSTMQTVYADEPGSAEMPSAGRPLTESLLARLMAIGIPIVPVVLHTGVSSQEAHEPPQPEPFTVPEVTARLVNSARRSGRRVVAVGTTVVRALETVADPRGRVHPASGWTRLVLGPSRPARAVGGLLTGLHAPESSHLDLLEAVVGSDLVTAGYRAVTDRPVTPTYLWHEFGDTMILLP
jgi:S-adenosylmethionine:tRNA ribosyltransferase-isomerase